MISKEEWLKLKKKEKILRDAARILRVSEEDLPKTIARFMREIKEMKEKI
ncbi:MAG: hypothetical protein RMJ18_00160 [Candidatus Aenigmarchaeota archaeon]|nr:hypothetical protein [Candidatus Aenigmarchaeota archaeon]MDW8159831.1 hypothetical protein [Candidatus Aenigmarchaeota archaeon]